LTFTVVDGTIQIMNKTVYLSIDIDFWNSGAQALDSLDSFFCSLQNIPTIAVMNHQQLLNHVNQNPANQLINIDTHSDISDEKGLDKLNCGTWVSYVKWRIKSEYLWIYSQSIDAGSCQATGSWKFGLHLWQKISARKAPQKLNITKLIGNKTLTGVGLCLSPDYIYDETLEETFNYIVDKYNIPYRKGRRNENYDRTCTPPLINKSVQKQLVDIYLKIDQKVDEANTDNRFYTYGTLIEQYQPKITELVKSINV
jgi:hypothetical protein